MRKAVLALLGAGLLMSACTLTDLVKFDYDINDPWSSWLKMEPGIYVCIDDSFGKGDLIAKGTDNSIIECNTDTSMPIPDKFGAFDGNKTVYSFGYTTYDKKDYLICDISVMSEEKGSTIATTTTDIQSTKALWGAKCVNLATFPSKYKKVQKGGSFQENYKWICQNYQTLAYVAPESQFITSYKEYGTKWSNDRYPNELNSKGWVVPYTAGGKFEFQEICQQKGWNDIGRRKILWGGCSWGEVDYVRAGVSGITYEEAAAYVEKVKSLGKYNKVHEDFADGSKSISFVAYSDDSTENTEGFSGYIYPGYSIKYTNYLTPTLSIEFSVCYMTYV